MFATTSDILSVFAHTSVRGAPSTNLKSTEMFGYTEHKLPHEIEDITTEAPDGKPASGFKFENANSMFGKSMQNTVIVVKVMITKFMFMCNQ